MTESVRLLYKIIRLNKYDVIVPFICHKCGRCCYNYVPALRADNLEKIAQYLNKPEEEIKFRLKECHEKIWNNKLPDKCLFLDEENQCSIYPLRPEPCRLYPLDTDFGKADVNCPGHKEFYRIVDVFFSRRIYASMRDPRYGQKDQIRRVPIREWPRLWRKFVRARHSNPMVLEFIKMNEVPEILYKEE